MGPTTLSLGAIGSAPRRMRQQFGISESLVLWLKNTSGAPCRKRVSVERRWYVVRKELRQQYAATNVHQIEASGKGRTCVRRKVEVLGKSKERVVTDMMLDLGEAST